MKTLYIECNMGAAGDMLMAALLELHPQPEIFLEKMNNLGLDNVKVTRETVSKCAIDGTHINVIINGEEEESHDHQHEHEQHHHDHEHEHHHHDHEHEHHQHDHEHEHHHHDHGHEHTHGSMKDIEHILSHMNIENSIKKDVLEVYNLIAHAESHAHGKPVTEIHFHELGNVDAVVDITGVCMLIHELNVDKIICSPIHVGSGQVRCAHGILPVPVPATAHILQNVPIYSGTIKGELCTPTGAALLKYFANEFTSMPIMKLEKTGYGMGKKDFEQANCIRVMLGETESKQNDAILELACNIDDMTGEEIGFATEMLFKAGALDVYNTPIQMKKNRPAVILTCICKAKEKNNIINCIFKHTSSLGIREYTINRHTLSRNIETVPTKFGDIKIKNSHGFNTTNSKYEFEDIARIARENNMSLKEVMQNINK